MFLCSSSLTLNQDNGMNHIILRIFTLNPKKFLVKPRPVLGVVTRWTHSVGPEYDNNIKVIASKRLRFGQAIFKFFNNKEDPLTAVKNT